MAGKQMDGIADFYKELQQEIRDEQLSSDEGGSREQLFTDFAVNLLTEGGLTADVRVAYHESLAPRNRHKINAYAIAENNETIDLFVSIFKSTHEAVRVSKAEVDMAVKQIMNFLENVSSREYVHKMEESSEIYQFAHTLSQSAGLKKNLSRINVFILTDATGTYVKQHTSWRDANVYFRLVDLRYLYNLSEKKAPAIEIDFTGNGFKVPCIQAEVANEEYQSYLALIPATALVYIYNEYGARLLEQNVRSFLQFTGKINKGIRHTIQHEPHMFLAFNNGIAATADELELKKTEGGCVIGSVKDFQIVNGGQTTASIFHTWKKDRVDISNILVQLKLTVIKDKSNFSEIVSRIAEYANTQNKISVSDLSSNTPFHIALEKLSRSIWTPSTDHQLSQTQWFYERARGQFKNERSAVKKSRLKAFDEQHPRAQFFTKEELAKFINSWEELRKDGNVLIGPHTVVKGSQKNYAQFVVHHTHTEPDARYFQDTIAKAILFRTAEKLYGIKPNAIGDMRYITVPYSLALLNLKKGTSTLLSKIWQKQSVPEELRNILYNLMVGVENFIKDKAPGALYGEWAKKEECWLAVKKQFLKG